MVSFEKSKIQKELIKYRGQTQGQEDNLIKEVPISIPNKYIKYNIHFINK